MEDTRCDSRSACDISLMSYRLVDTRRINIFEVEGKPHYLQCQQDVNSAADHFWKEMYKKSDESDDTKYSSCLELAASPCIITAHSIITFQLHTAIVKLHQVLITMLTQLIKLSILSVTHPSLT